jgi:tetratricopeptide (TPR) repeat protein
VGELARHWTSATQPIDLTKAIGYSRQAGDAALAALAPADALRYYAQAIDLHLQTTDPDPTLGIDLAIGLGIAQRQTGEPAFRDTLLGASRQAADVGDTSRLVAAAVANNRGFVSAAGVVDIDKVEVLEMALDRLSADAPDRSLVLATLCQELQYGAVPDRRRALAEEAAAIARASGDDALLVRVFNHTFNPSLVVESVSWNEDALMLASRLGDPVQLFLAADRRAVAATNAGDIDEMDRCIEIMRSAVETLNQPSLTWVLTFVRATRAQIAGDTDLAEQLAEEALQIGTEGGEPDAALIWGAQALIVSLQRGTMGELVPFITQAAADNPNLPTYIAVLAMAYVEGDRLDEARHLLEEFAADDFDLPVDQEWLTGMVSYSGAAIQCHDPRYAGPLFDQLSPWADTWSTTTGPTAEGPVSYFLGGLATVLGRYDEADAYFANSAASSARAHAKFFAAQTDLLWGKMLAERGAPGDLEKARDLLTKAQTVAADNGYGNVERRAAEQLQLLDA